MRVTRAHFEPLLRVELRSVIPVTRRTLGAASIVALALLATGHFTAENTALVAGAISISFALIAPVAMMRDKYDGTLEVVRALPVHTDTISAAKMCVASLTIVPAAVLAGAAFAWAAREAGSPSAAPLMFVALFGVAYLGLTLFAWGLLAVLARYEPDQLSYLPIVFFASTFLIVGPILDRLVPDPAGALRWFVGQVWAPAITTFTLALFVVAAGYWSLRTISRGIEAYARRPRPELLRAP